MTAGGGGQGGWRLEGVGRVGGEGGGKKGGRGCHGTKKVRCSHFKPFPQKLFT